MKQINKSLDWFPPAAKTGSKVVGEPDAFADILTKTGEPGIVTSVEEAKPYHQVFFNSNKHLHQLVHPNSSISEYSKAATAASQLSMYMVRLSAIRSS